MKLISLFFCLLVMSETSYSSPTGTWNRNSNPEIMSSTFKKKFSSLPLSGLALGAKKYWSSYYWPLFMGNINLRWNTPKPQGFNLDSPNYEAAAKMDMKELESLAPSEKYDLFLGNYSYPLKREVEKRVSPRRKEWEGICHGWAPAALNHDEPAPKIVTNPDGLKIPFGSSDIKALLSYYYAYHYDAVTTHQMGRRCNGSQYCNGDLNPGAFHIALTNKLGLEGRGFIADIENGKEVWNHVVQSYISTIIDKNIPPTITSSKGTVRLIRVKTRVRVVGNIENNSWYPAIGTNNQTYYDLDYVYDLEIDKKGNILGGEWMSKRKPDFMWYVSPAKNFKGLFSKLPELLQ